VPEIGKAAGERCVHLTDKGCGIYATRPESCRTYFCLWADPKSSEMRIPEWGRPDRINVVLNAIGHDLNRDRRLIAFELQSGAANEYWADKVLKRLRKRFVIAVQHGKQFKQILTRTETVNV
jgi:Fe-S-cluster containining protein